MLDSLLEKSKLSLQSTYLLNIKLPINVNIVILVFVNYPILNYFWFRHYEQEMQNIGDNIDYTDMTDEQKQELYKKCIKSVYVEHDGITSHGRIIEINMIDGVKHTIHMTKRGNYFNTFIVLKDKEKPLDDLQITARFIRKKKR